MEKFLILTLAIASVSFTVTVTGIFKPVREKVGKIHSKIDELLHCPYCFGHWVTFATVYFTGTPYTFTRWGFYSPFADFLISCFAIMGAVGIVHHVLLRAYEPVAKSATKRKLENLQNQQSN